MSDLKTESQSQLLLPSKDLNEDIDFFSKLGFRLDQIYPDDDPSMANMSGHGMLIRLDVHCQALPATIHLLTDHPEQIDPIMREWTAPNACKIKVLPKSFRVNHPPTKHKFETRKLENNDPWVIGRAGMLYRDLIPDRLGGSIMASHISVPIGGPVPDMVHYHTIGFQLIFCYRGWVRLQYEDQGPSFVLHAGECVTQPPEIRHRVLEASDHLEVIEIGVPAEHMTTIDHEMELPTPAYLPEREFQGQKFCRHQLKEAHWERWKIPGFEYRKTGVREATADIADVRVIRSAGQVQSPPSLVHDADILFSFIMNGNIELWAEGHEMQKLSKGDAFVIPPALHYRLNNCSHDFELLEVSLPGNFKTSIVS